LVLHRLYDDLGRCAAVLVVWGAGVVAVFADPDGSDRSDGDQHLFAVLGDGRRRSPAVNLLDDLGSLASKYGHALASYVFAFLGLNLANASGQVNAGVGTAAVAALFPAVIHLGVDVVNDVRGIVKAAKAGPPAGA
jgi:hypothetical protein